MYKTISQCSVCSSKHLENIIQLPNLPLTGIYLNKNEPDTYQTIDQGLEICTNCGHAQLTNMVDSAYLYKDTYTHRSGESPIATSGNDFFIDFFNDTYHKNQLNTIFEIGCNDLYLLSQLKSKAEELVGVDPIWEKGITKKDNLTIFGGFAEDVDYQKLFKNKPDVVISSHTFEHIQDVHSVLQSVLNNVDEGTEFLIEVPSLDTLLKLCRFDQVFHQHFNYFSLHSFFNFIKLHECEFLNYKFNYNYWGGTMLIHFRKNKNTSQKNPFKKYSKNDILSSFKIFKNELSNLENILKNFDEDIYGFGAAQMLPILAYHFEDFSFMKAIIDDNPKRCNKKLVGLDIPIVSSDDLDNINDSIIVVTALDSTKVILQRLNEIVKPRYIIKPIQIF